MHAACTSLWHAAQSTYTGVYARGGPSSVDQMPFDLGTLVDRSVGQPPSPRRPDRWAGGNVRICIHEYACTCPLTRADMVARAELHCAELRSGIDPSPTTLAVCPSCRCCCAAEQQQAQSTTGIGRCHLCRRDAGSTQHRRRQRGARQRWWRQAQRPPCPEPLCRGPASQQGQR